jgi:hypothetical protein
MRRSLFAAAALAALLFSTSAPASASTFTLINLDGAGEGFNDATAAAPVGGNPGTTRGEQRLNVFRQACAIWGTILPSNVNIRVAAQFSALTPCDATSGVLGSAGAATTAVNFPGAPIANTYYPIALANKLAGTDLAPSTNDINANFNSSVDDAVCLGSSSWYYGYDHAKGTNVDLLTVVLHELGHGLGFQTFANLSTGAYLNGQYPDIYLRNLFDRSYGLRWDQMTNGQRAASATNTGNLVWNGTYVRNAAPQILGPAAVVRVDSPAGLAGEKQFGTADFGGAMPQPSLSAEVVLVVDGVFPTTDGCEAFVNAAELVGKIALIDRGTCTFAQKAARAQAAGAVAVIIGNNVAGTAPGMSGSDPSITIPVVSITQNDAALIQDELSAGGTVMATIGTDPAHLAGTDAEGRPRMYAPAPIEGGSSVSHWDVTETPNLLMEPFISSDLTSSVDLTQYAFVDIGWLTGVSAVATGGPVAGAPRAFSSPNPFRSATSIRFQMAQPGRASVEVFDASGALVKRMPLAWRPAGPQVMEWDGNDTRGGRAPAGVYFWRVQAGEDLHTGRMVRVQ